MFKAKWLCFLLVFAFMPVVWSGYVSPYLDDYLQGFSTSSDVKVLVMLHDQADIETLNQQLKQEKATLAERNRRVVEALQEVATNSQPAVISYFDGLKNQGLISDYRMVWLANMAIVTSTKDGVYEMATNQAIDEIALCYEIEDIKPVEVEPSEQDLIASVEIGLERINAPAAWAAGFTGAGRVVANIDTGVDGNHPALSGRFRGDVDNDGDVDESWYDPYTTNWPTPQDVGRHGTHTMGTICGRTEAGDTIGVAIDAQWIAAAAIDRGGGIPRTVADAILSFQWMADPDDNPTTQDNPDAVGNSWGVTTGHGYPPCDETFWTVIDNLEAAGTVVIFSAGNEGANPGTLRRPADRATTRYNVFSVGAVNGNDSSLPIASFSSRGPSYCTPDGQETYKPEVVAPGVDIRSSVPGGGYTTMSGTSMASPHVTGAVGVIRSVNPDLDVESIKEILMSTAHDLGPEGPDNAYGIGIIDVYEACLVAMDGYGTIDGTVYDGQEHPIVNALITINGSTRHIYTDNEGYYSIGVPADTTYSLTASYFGFIPETVDVAVLPDETVTQDFDLEAAPNGSVEGYVRTLENEPIDEAVVRIADTPLPSVETNAEGYYIINNIPGGLVYTVEAGALGYGYASAEVFITADDTAEANFSLLELESFEISNGGYQGEGVWQWGEPSSGPNEAFDGNNVWATVLGGSYSSDSDDSLMTPQFLIQSDNSMFSFYHWYVFEANWDGGQVLISTNDGGSWELLIPIGGYPNNEVDGLGDTPGFSDSLATWELVTYDLGDYNGETVKFCFRFGSDGSTVRAGWYIDGVVVTDAMIVAPDGDMSHSSMLAELPVGSDTTYSMTLTNNGDAALYYDVTVINDVSIYTAQTEPQFYGDDIQSKDGYLIDEDGHIKGLDTAPTSDGVVTSIGGPDEFGYTYIDSDEPNGPVYNWIDITDIGTQVSWIGGWNPIDDGYTEPLDLGMEFEFYDNVFTTVQASTNGWLSFNTNTNAYLTNVGMPSTSDPNNIIAVIWDDLDGGTSGNAYYYYDEAENRFIFSWINWHFYRDEDTPQFSVQAILDGDDNSIVIQYGDITGPYQTDVTIGIENESGTMGLEYAFDNASLQPGTAVKFIYPNFWLFVDPRDGIIPPGQSVNFDVTFDATDIERGWYYGEIRIMTNDPGHGMFTVPCTLGVGMISVDDYNAAVPTAFALNQNYPNPFNPTTEILFGLPVDGHVSLEVYDVMGRLVTKLVNEDMAAGNHSVVWDGTNDSGDNVTSGVYFYKLSQADNTTTKKMIMLK